MGSPIFYLVGILIFLLLRTPCQISEHYDNPFWVKSNSAGRKKKNHLRNHINSQARDLKIVNFKAQEQILFENALRSVLALVPNGDRYELNCNTRLVTKQT